MSDGGINKFIKVVAVLLLLPLSVVIPTLSLESYYAPQTSAQTPTDAALEKRKESYKAKLKDELSASAQQRIKVRCLAVQTIIKALNVRVEGIKTKRGQAYDNIVNRLKELSEGLDAQAYDTTTLNENITELSGKIDAYKTSIDTYKQAVEDMTVIDCSQDPTSFKAALEVARTEHAKLVTQVADIRTYIVNTLKPQLQNIKASLEPSGAPVSPNTNDTEEND